MTRDGPALGHLARVVFIFVLLPAAARHGERKLVAQRVARVFETDVHRRVCVSKSHDSPNVTAVDQDGQGGRVRRELRYGRASNHDAVIR